MLMNILVAASAVAQAYGAPSAAPTPTAPAVTTAPAATAPVSVAILGRTLKDLPGVTTTYYDVAGKTGPAIDKSFKKIFDDPALKDATRPLSWDVGTSIMKRTEGTKCTITSAKSKLTATVRLPRLAEIAKVRKDALASWNIYITGVENEMAANLWYLSDRLRGAEQILVGLPCEQASLTWDAKVETIKTEFKAFVAQRAQPAKTPPA